MCLLSNYIIVYNIIMLGINDKWPQKINNLIHVNRGLNSKETNYIFNTLKVTVGKIVSLESGNF